MFSPSDDIEYAAIKTIHKQLDDNADGSVDFSESAEVSQGGSGDSEDALCTSSQFRFVIFVVPYPLPL